MSYLILAQSEVTARALGAWLELLGERPLQEDDRKLVDDRCVVVEPLIRNGDQGVAAFETVVDRVTKVLAEVSPLPLTVLVDAVKPDSLDPLGEGGDWDSLLAMLILAVPEVRWVFGVNSQEQGWKIWHSLPTLLAMPWRNPLLDPTGLRNHVRKKCKKNRPPVRSEGAASLDEEVHYALFHGYTAYRFGYRADVVTSWKLMEELFAGEDRPHGFRILLEDVNLYFPDRKAATKLSDFEASRASHCPKLAYDKELESSEFRIMVTTGHSDSRKENCPIEKNKAYLELCKSGRWSLVLKPTGGMFDLWTKARLFERYPMRLATKGSGFSRAGQADGFVWPPCKDAESDDPNDPSHSAPGKLMLVASHLIRRADALRESANTVEECIRGAVLATDALELLGYRTPTLALQALELKQWFETKAEVAFVGVGHHFQLKRRFREIERETRVAARFHHKGRRDASALDSAVTIANRLTLVFREAGQFDEEEECLRKLRWWNRKLSFRRARDKYHLWPGLALLAYAEWMISSLGWLLLSVAAWMLLLALLWWAWTMDGHSWDAAVKGTLEAFIGSGIETDQGEGIVFLSSFSAMLGFFHLGVFVSYLYSAIARK